MLYENELLIGTICNRMFYLLVCKLTHLFYMLFRYQVRTLKGAFQRAYGIHAGAALVKVCCVKKIVSLHLEVLCDITFPHWSLCVKGA